MGLPVRLIALPMIAAVVACDCGGADDEHACRSVSDLEFEIAAEIEPYPVDLPGGTRAFAIIGDTQRTSYPECLLGREVNDDASRDLLALVAAEQPAFLVMVGDMVFDGSDARHWAYFDFLMAPVREARVPVRPLVGNHERWGDDEAARRNLTERFPGLGGDTWYRERYGRLGLVWLDSNRDDLADEVWGRQLRWYRRALAALDADDEVAGVIVFLHHAPYTNSTFVDGDEAVQRDLVPPFCRSAKTVALVAGHAHGYERFVRGRSEGCGGRDRTFIVSAGGGGPRPHALRAAAETGLVDAFDGGAPRPFHYLVVQEETDGVRIAVRGLAPGPTRRRVELLHLPFPRLD